MPRHYKWLGTLVASAALVYSSFAAAPSTLTAKAQSAGPCGIANPAFCDSFDAPSVNGGRGGQMAPIWGVSRVTGNANLSGNYDNAWGDTDIIMCDGSVRRVSPPNDIQICNGQLREAINDTGMNNLAMYPRQPFDIAGRTGTVAFDVSDDTSGSHAAWPEFSFTDQPIPAPSPNQVAFPGVLLARNSLNIEFSANVQPDCVTVDYAWTSQNYSTHLVNVVQDACMNEPAHGSFMLNHVEIHINSNGWEVFGSDPGTRTMKRIAHSSSPVPLTRGLVWMKDVHYNGDKPCETQPSLQCQGMHTFAWDNFGFDGPVLPQDLGVQLPDHTAIVDGYPPNNHYPTRDLGTVLNMTVPTRQRATLNFSGAQALSHVENASAALLEMNYYAYDQVTFHYKVNDNAEHVQEWTPGIPTWFQEQIAFPVPLAELHNGDNSVEFWVTNAPSNLFGFSEVDMILVGAGGGSSGPPPTSTPVPPTASPIPSTPVPTSTPGTGFTQALNKGDSVQVTCTGGTLSLVSQSGTSDILACN